MWKSITYYQRENAMIKAMMNILASGFIFAQRNLEIEYPTVEGMRPETTAIGLPEYVKYIFNFSLGLAVLVVFIVLFYAGFRYLTSAGNPVKQKDARRHVLAAVLGLMILLFSYLILITINPQLVILTLPEKITFSAPPTAAPPTAEPNTLYYTEIPIGGLIEELFTKARMESIEKVSQGVKTVSEDLSKKAEVINSLTSQCACSVSSPECGGECSGGFCVGDPCPAKGEINKKREELSKIISDTGAITTIQYWQKKLEVEINGSSGEKIIGFKQVYEDLKKAKDLIKNCQGVGSKGGLKFLSGYSDFQEHLDRLRDVQPTQRFVPDFPFDYIFSTNPYYLATFYCAESSEPYLQFVPEEISVQLEEVNGEQVSSQTMYCGDEIPIGETIDNAEALAGKILNELENIKNNISKEITAAQSLIESSNPEGCVASNCHTNCTWIEKECWESSPCPEEPPLEEPLPVEPPPGEELPPVEPESPWWDWWDGLFFKPDYSFAAEDCGGWVDCSYCEIPDCSGPSCLDAKPQIGIQAAEIKNSDSQIASSYKQIKKFIEEKEIADSLKMFHIFKTLSAVQPELGECYTPKNRYAQLERGEETNLESLLSCSGLKQITDMGSPFYDEAGNTIEQCYGPDNTSPDLMDNFFCCFNNISF